MNSTGTMFSISFFSLYLFGPTCCQLHQDWPVEEDASSDHLVGIGACPCSPHLLALQAIKDCLRIKWTQRLDEPSSTGLPQPGATRINHQICIKSKEWMSFSRISNKIQICFMVKNFQIDATSFLDILKGLFYIWVLKLRKSHIWPCTLKACEGGPRRKTPSHPQSWVFSARNQKQKNYKLNIWHTDEAKEYVGVNSCCVSFDTCPRFIHSFSSSESGVSVVHSGNHSTFSMALGCTNRKRDKTNHESKGGYKLLKRSTVHWDTYIIK